MTDQQAGKKPKRYPVRVEKKEVVAKEEAAVKKTADCPELEVIPAQGAMYAMVRISVNALVGIKDDTDFAQQLLQEENLVVLPGACFGIKNFVRILTCPSKDVVSESIDRMNDFCQRRRRKRDRASYRRVLEGTREY